MLNQHKSTCSIRPVCPAGIQLPQLPYEMDTDIYQVASFMRCTAPGLRSNVQHMNWNVCTRAVTFCGRDSFNTFAARAYKRSKTIKQWNMSSLPCPYRLIETLWHRIRLFVEEIASLSTYLNPWCHLYWHCVPYQCLWATIRGVPPCGDCAATYLAHHNNFWNRALSITAVTFPMIKSISILIESVSNTRRYCATACSQPNWLQNQVANFTFLPEIWRGCI